MRFLKILGIFILSLVVILLVIALFIKKEYTVERSVVVHKPRTEVYEYVKYLKNQEKYSKWATMDPDMTSTYSGTDATPGFTNKWDSEKDDVGAGEQEIKSLTPNERVNFEIRFLRPFKSTSNAALILEDTATTQTRVTWNFNSKMDYPMNLMLVFMDLNKAIGNDLEVGLSNLKSNLEK